MVRIAGIASGDQAPNCRVCGCDISRILVARPRAVPMARPSLARLTSRGVRSVMERGMSGQSGDGQQQAAMAEVRSCLRITRWMQPQFLSHGKDSASQVAG